MPIFPRFTSLAIFVVFLAGCTTAISTSDSSSIASQSFPSAPAVSGTATLSVNRAPPSFTSSPGNTPGPSVFNQVVYDATQSVVQTKVAQFPRVCTEDYSRPNYSPNDLWMEDACISKNDHDLIMTLSNRETRALWKLRYKDYIPSTDSADGGLLVVHWSNDGKYAYFTSFLGGDGGECFFNRFDNGSGLFRIDLQIGQTKAILPLKENSFWYGFSLSPTDRRLVYGVRSLDLKVLDLPTGQQIDVAHESNFSQGGGYIWSPDGLEFVYSTVTYAANHAGRENYSLRLVDARSGSEQILLESPETCFVATSWIEDNILILEKNYGEELIEFDLHSNKIVSESTTTP